MEKNQYDLIIIGSGPAGMSAAVYAHRYNLKTLIFGEKLGGMVSEASNIYNFLSYDKIKGFELVSRMRDHIKECSTEVKQEKVIEILKKDQIFEIKTEKDLYYAKKIILATGTEKRKLDLPKENKFKSKGISYYAVCDALSYKDKTVAVVGGGNSAVNAALLLAELASKVYIIYRKDQFFRPEPATVDLINQNQKIEVLFSRNITELIGEEKLDAVKLDNNDIIKIDGLFIELGATPNTILAEKIGVELDKGYIKVDKNQKTNINGIFAAGDITNNVLKQIITAASEGAIAVKGVYSEIKRN